ncbi:uncharacterized protein LOC124261094 [Haliotis rubra]|uniref:uncharacterized protein LOC124261094 n=1 Tax=Haliotis rubra TaxID=36100 RepID=UPI001EE61980|nr:uncharacterized protein LOC124261094 [Haliotis rubra]
MPVPFDSAICILIILSQELWRHTEQVYSVNLYIRVLVTEYESQHHLYQQDQGLGPRRRRQRPRGPLMASQESAVQTDPEQLGTVAEVEPSSAAVVGQAATSTTGDPEVPVPHTAGQQDSGYGSPGQMAEQQRPADVARNANKATEHGAEGQDDGAGKQADSAGGQAGVGACDAGGQAGVGLVMLGVRLGWGLVMLGS